MIVYVCAYRSSGAYEALRSSGCVKLPSQRTLRDYTHYIKAAMGFSSDVDNMLMEVAKVRCCPEKEKNVTLLLDEIHVKEDLAYDKHSGAMIRFANLGDINNHLLQFESSLGRQANVSSIGKEHDGIHGSWLIQHIAVSICTISPCKPVWRFAVPAILGGY